MSTSASTITTRAPRPAAEPPFPRPALHVVFGVVTIAAWAAFAIVDDTIGAAAIAAVASLVNTLLIVRHGRQVDERLEKRRTVIVGTVDPDADEVVVIAPEERRELEDRRIRPEVRKERGRRRSQRRK